MSEGPPGHTGHRQRLRDRLLAGGEDALHDHELVEYLLGLAVPRRDTKPLAKELLGRFGNIGALLSASPELLRREGLTEGMIGALMIAGATARALLEAKVKDGPILSSWDALSDYLRATMAHSPVEEVRVLFLNAKNRLIANEAMWRGTVDQAAVHLREVVARAIDLQATALILVHNHPSGDPTPSQADIRLTRDLVDAGRHLGIAVHDHVIVAAQGQSSLRAMGLI